MNAAESAPPILPEPVPSARKALQRLFLTLFLRGRGVRGLNKQGVPKSVGQKLALTLVFYLLLGCMALFFHGQPVFALAAYLHAMTFVFLGMFVASSAGEILFNKEEADILLHRPVSPETLLWAKVRVLFEVSLWLAGAFNLVGLFVGIGASGNWRFPLVHLASTTLEAVFCTGCVVLVYQLCLRWFGRERLEGLMTIAQVLVSVAAVTAGQLLPQFVFRLNGVLNVHDLAWEVRLLPPAWFAGLDDALAGSAMPGAWLLASLAVGATFLVLWLAFGKLAKAYETGLQGLNETLSPRVQKGSRRRWLDRLVQVPPLSWWLREPVTRASFLLCSAYLLRDREVKLRVYPGLAPILVIPFVFLLRRGGSDAPGFGVPFCGVYLGMVPLLGLQMLQYSAQWQAGDIFRTAPLPGPAAVCRGARRAVLCLLTLPMLLLVAVIVRLLRGDPAQLLLLLPGVVALPVFSLVPALGGQGVPLSLPIDQATAARRGTKVLLATFIAFPLAGVATLSWSQGWFGRFLLAEAIVAGALYAAMRLSVARAGWASRE